MRSLQAKRLLVAIPVLAGMVAGSPAHQARAVPQPTTDSRGAEALDAANRRAARDLARLASIDLQIAGASATRDFRIAALLLQVAHQFAPDDEQVLRLLVDAASSSGDRDLLLAATRTLLRIHPDDTVVQLRLVSGGINSRQDADSRLEAYEQLLAFADKAGNKLDPSIRSRLALDAALILRERGDLQGFADKLALASELDVTNKDAASLAVSFYTDQASDAVGRLTLLINLLKADPFDPDTHLSIARELAAGDAVTQATRFYESYSMLKTVRREAIATSIAAESATLLWETDGAPALVRRMREQVEVERSQVAAAQQAAIREDKPLDQIPDPERVRLSPELERVRLAAALASGDSAQADYAYEELLRTFELQILLAQNRTSMPRNSTDQDVLDKVRRLRGELMWMQIWSGRQVERAIATLDDFKKDPEIASAPDAATVFARMDGWVLIHRGELDAAQETLADLGAADVLARLGLCALKERRGDLQGALADYQSLAWDGAGTLAGAFARTRYEVLAGKRLSRAPGAAPLEALGAGVPKWLEDMIADPRRIVSIRATLENDLVDPLQSAMVRLRIRNVSPIPLAIGPERPINSRFLFVPKVEAALRPVSAVTGVVVARAERKLRLLPQEEIEVEVWADQGNMGWILNRLASVPITIKWRAVQGFLLDSDGLFVPGPQCQAVETETLRRRQTNKAYDDGAATVRWIQTGSEADIAEVLLMSHVNTQVSAEEGGAWSQEQRDAVGAALGARYPALSRAARLSIITTLPLKEQAAWLKPVEDAIAAEADPGLQLAAIALRVTDPADPRLVAAAASTDPRLAEMSNLVISRINANAPTFANVIIKERERAEQEQKRREQNQLANPAPAGGSPADANK